MRVTVERSRCLGAGQCEQLAPEVFRQDEEGLSRVLVAEPDPASWPRVLQTVDLCPVQAVLVEEGPGRAPQDTK
ncbi:ferredoxin [Streptomyces sp. NPDC004330]|uniref:ferredoxin n=1 Tax=Streptomyces sp. NPDC004330 TaxID=3364700 RepID=UPI0036807006